MYFRKELIKNEKPLYRYKLTDDMKLVKSQPIYFYNKEKFGIQQYAEERYMFKVDGESGYSYVKAKDLDKISHNRYYTFCDDDEKIRKIFLDSFIAKVAKAQKELDSNMKMLENFKSNN